MEAGYGARRHPIGAMRIAGISVRDMVEAGRDKDIDFDRTILDAVKLIRGETEVPGIEPDEVRDQLLGGYSHILVDEYQDIHQAQYDLVSAIAGRTLEDIDGRLSIMAVGDDDQNIYAFCVWDDCAILARSRNALWPVRSLLEQAGVPVKTLIENSLPLNRVREFSAFRDRVKADKWEVPVLEVVFE